MGIVVGIDIGGSTTKIVGFDDEKMLVPVQITASNALASLFGGFGKFLYDNKLGLDDVSQVNVTGVGSNQVDKAIYGLPTYLVDEFTANGLGGGFFANGKKEFIVISMGTGSSYVGVKDGKPEHLGGIGIGGGTIIGLSKLMLSTNDIDKIIDLASHGSVGNIDLRVGDISKNPLPGLDLDVTASNFGKASSRANCEDKAAGITHMVIETIMQTAALIATSRGFKDLIAIGNLIKFLGIEEVLDMERSLFPELNFVIPKDGEYGTAIGAALATDCLKRV